MGRILLVDDDWICRRVALKELLPEFRSTTSDRSGGNARPFSKQSLERRFVQEARITGQLEHPAIIPIYEIGTQEDGSLYYTMRYVRGRTFKDRLAECGDLKERLSLLPNYLDVCHGIAFAHSRGVVHRDIKPANVLIGEFGETVIIDWGLAKQLDGESSASDQSDRRISDTHLRSDLRPDDTSPWVRLGSPHYMAPEQAAALSDKVDERSDVYALGSVLYEILTGRRPFEDTNVETLLERVQTDEPPRVRQLERHAPPELQTICQKALSKSPGDRYPSARELAADMERFLSGALVEAYDYSLLEVILRAYRKKRAVLNVLALSVFIVSALVLFGFRSIGDARDQALLSRDREVHARQLADWERYIAQVSLAKNQIESNDVSSALGTLNSVSPYHRNWEWGYLYNVCNQSTIMADGFSLVGISDDGEALASAGRRQPLTVWDAETMTPRLTLPDTEGIVTAFTFNHNGSILISGDESGTIRIWDLSSGELLQQHIANTGPVTDIAHSVDGNRLATMDANGELKVWEGQDSGMHVILTADATSSIEPDSTFLTPGLADFKVALSASGRFVLTIVHPWNTTNGRIQVWDLDKTDNARMLTTDGARPVMLPSADTLMFIRNGVIVLIRLADEKAHEQLIAISNHQVIDADISANGDWIGALTASGSVYAMPARSITMSPVQVALPNVFAEENRIEGGPDSLFVLLSEDGPFRICDAGGRTPTKEFRGHAGAVRRIVFAPNGDEIVTSGIDYTLRLWSLEREQAIETLHRFGSWATDIADTGQGSLLAVSGIGSPLLLLDKHSLDRSQVKFDVDDDSGGRIAAVSPDGRYAVASKDRITPIVINLESERQIAELRGHADNVTTARFSKDGTTVLTASWDGTVRLWDRASGKERLRLDHGAISVYNARFTPSEQGIIAGYSNGQLVLWDATSGERMYTTVAHSEGITATLLTRAGDVLITASQDGSIREWDPSNLQLRAELLANGSAVMCLALSPNEDRFVSGNTHGECTIWDWPNRRAIVTIRGHTGSVFALAFTQKGRTLLSVGEDGRVRAWKTDHSWEIGE